MRYILMAIVAISLTACGGGNRTTTVETNGSTLPEWYSYPSIGDNVGAVGIARPSRAGLAIQNERAENNGRIKLARALEARLKSLFADYVAEGNEIGTEKDQGLTAEYFESVSKTVTSRIMQGSIVRDTFHDDEGYVYTWVILNDNAINQAARAIVDEMDQDRLAAMRAEVRAREAFDRLDAEVQEEIKLRDAAVAEMAGALTERDVP